MTRALLDEIVLFLSPFIAYAFWLMLKRQSPLHGPHWEGKMTWLSIIGFSFVIVSFVILGLTGNKEQGAYTPARMENGQLIPAEIK